MAVQKALLITADNASSVLTNYEMGGWEEDDIIGMYLVASFGSRMDWNLLSKVAMDKLYDEVDPDEYYNKEGRKMENGYFPVRRKE